MGLKITGIITPPQPIIKTPEPKPAKLKPIKAKKEDEEPAKSLEEIISGIKKHKGDKVIVRGNQIETPTRLPTGIFEWDFFLGGGFPNGRYSIVYGPESSCKTNIALKAAAVAQRLPGPCNKVVWVNVEQSFDAQWAQRMGLDVNELQVVEPGYGEEAVDIIDGVVRGSDVALVVVDSIAALIANKEIGQSSENYDVGTSALLIKRLVNKLMVAFGECRKLGHYPCVILINQTRFKIGVSFGDPETMPGGIAQKFLSSLRVRVSGKNQINTDTSKVTFKEVRCTVKKAKIPIRAVAFEMRMCMDAVGNLDVGDTDSFTMVKGLLQSLGLLTKEGTQYKVHSKPPLSFPTIGAIDAKYNGDREFQRFMQQLVLDNYKEQMITVEEVQPQPAHVQPGVVQPIADGE